MLLTEDVLERLYSKIDRTGDGCHEWLGGKNTYGYGHLKITGKLYLAHRLVLEIKQPGFLESGLHACHICDNSGCCNPKHLWAGTNQENVQDRNAKGRDLPTRIASTGNQWSRGSKCGKAKLTESDVLQIVALLNQGLSQKEIATMFNIHPQTISKIKTGRIWGWLTRRT